MTLPLVALAWLLGIAAVAIWDAPAWMGAAWVACLVPVAALWMGRRGAVVMGLAALLALGGGLRFAGWQDRPLPDLASYAGQTLSLDGHVASEPDPGLTTRRYRVDVDRVFQDGSWASTGGAVLLTASQYTELLPGDRVLLTGQLAEAPVFEDFDYRGYLARRGIVATMLRPRLEVVSEGSPWDLDRTATEARLNLEDALSRALPEPEASLGAGIVFGRDGNLPDAVKEDFRVSGLAHIVAVSGSNVAIVAALVFLAATIVLRRTWAMLPAAVAIVLYVGLAGFTASVVRAAIMAVVFLLGEALGRQQSGLAALGAAAIVMTAFQPSAAQDVGFQLSLAATVGLIVFAPWIRYGLEWVLARSRAGDLVPALAVQAAGFTLSATVATLPVTWVNFGRVSLVGPVANVVVEPLFVVAFALSGLAAVAGVAWEPAGWALGLFAYYPLAAITWVARTAANMPGAAIDVPNGGGESALAAYAAMALLAWPAYRFIAPVEGRERPSPRLKVAKRAALAAAVVGAAVVVLRVSVLPAAGPGELEITALDVGQGDAILVTTPGGRHVLIDGGVSGIGLARELSAMLPHWERTIDRIVLTHPQEDHLAGLPGVLRRYDVTAETDSGATNGTDAFAVYRRDATDRWQVHRGDEWELDGVRFEVLWPPAGYRTGNLNDTSVVLRVTYGDVRVLLTGDFEAPAQRALMALEDVRADLLKVPHHGSKTTAPEFLASVDAGVAVISVGADNRFGHPSAETLTALRGARILRTDLSGRVTVRTDGHRLQISTQR
jgi:competence protein ComEC